MNQIAENITLIQKGIEKSVKSVGHDSKDIHLIAISKKQPDDRIQAALDSGHRIFGENRVQDAKERWTQRKEQYPDLQLHLVGPLQTNKVKEAVALFDVIHTIDRPKLAHKLKEEAHKQKRTIRFFIQVNTGEEDQKSGILPPFAQAIQEILGYQDDLFSCQGLMCIPPQSEAAGVHFSFLKTLAMSHGLKDLSMGMSSDYKDAIAAGATHIRIGSALFGKRL